MPLLDTLAVLKIPGHLVAGTPSPARRFADEIHTRGKGGGPGPPEAASGVVGLRGRYVDMVGPCVVHRQQRLGHLAFAHAQVAVI